MFTKEPTPTVMAAAVQRANDEPKMEKQPMQTRKNKTWSEEENQFLQDNLHLSRRKLASHLGRSVKAVEQRLIKLRKAGVLETKNRTFIKVSQPTTGAKKPATTTSEPTNIRSYRRRLKTQSYAYENKHIRIYSDTPFGWFKRLRYGVKELVA